jgi:hypothetical protein
LANNPIRWEESETIAIARRAFTMDAAVGVIIGAVITGAIVGRNEL